MIDERGIAYLSGLENKGSLTLYSGNKKRCTVNYQLDSSPASSGLYEIIKTCSVNQE